jgi:hypothetical protein
MSTISKTMLLVFNITVSIIVWAIGYHFFYLGYGHPIISLGLVIGGGILVFLLIEGAGKPWESSSQLAIDIGLSAAVALGLLLVAPSVVSNNVGAHVYCYGTGREYVSPDPINVAWNGTVNWYFHSNQNIYIEVTFDKGFEPFGSGLGQHSFTGNSASSAPIGKQAINSGDGYYSFTCKYPTGDKKIDPMIHVPR